MQRRPGKSWTEQKLPDSLSELTFPLLRQLTAPHQGFISTMARPLDLASEDEEKAVAVVEVNIEGVAITEEEEATIEMIDTTTEDLPHQADTMIEVVKIVILCVFETLIF